jgi:hypothetical protein
MKPSRAFASSLVLTLGLLFTSHAAISQMSVEEQVDMSSLPELNTQMFTVEKKKPAADADYGRSGDAAVSRGSLF